jgi:transcriptional regulator with XRE-family HTH domain
LGTYGQVAAEWLRQAIATHWRGNKDELAGQSGLSRSAVYGVLSGQGYPEQSTLDALAGALGVPKPQFRVDPVTPDAVGWIGEARAALDRAERLLTPGPVLGLPRDAVDAVADGTAADGVLGVPPEEGPGLEGGQAG